MSSKQQKYSPMIMQYLEVKEKYPDTILFYRVGDFYEMFFDDAKVASAELELVLTGKDAGVENKEFWVDEFFATVSNGNVKEQAESALQTIVGAICAQQLGIENIILWQLFDQAWADTLENSSEFINGIHMTGTCPSLYVSDVPYASYYPISTFMRFNSANNGKAFATSSKNSSSAQGIYIGAMQTDDGNIVITVVNIGASEQLFSVNLEKALSKDLYRYSVLSESITPSADASVEEYGRIFKEVGSTFTDTIAPYSVSVYTSEAK